MAMMEQPSTIDPSKTNASAETLDVTLPTTPSTPSSSAHQLFSEISDIHTRLGVLSSLAPSRTVNTLLTRLVNLCVAPYSTEVTTCFFEIPGVEELCEKLRSICSTAEGELEMYWAEHMLANMTKDPSSSDILKTYPYYDNYSDHAHLEASVIESFFGTFSPRSMAFLGSGPLPLTSLCFQRHFPAIHIYNVDRHVDAINLSAALCRQLGFKDRMAFVHEDVQNPSPKADWMNSDIVFLAALVGTDTKSKLDILRNLAPKLRPACLVVVRSARGMRSVLYSVLELSQDFEAAGFEILAEVHPWTKVVNSFILFRVKKRE